MTRTQQRIVKGLVVTGALTLAGVALAAGGGHGADHGPVAWYKSGWAKIGFHAFNLVVLLTIIFKYALPVIRESLRGRAVGIKNELGDADSVRKAAQARHAEIEARLAKLSDEVAGIRSQADKDGQAEQARLEARAKAAAQQIAETAERQIADEAARAKQALRKEAVSLAVELAEDLLKNNIGNEDQQRLAAQVLTTVKEAEVSHHV